MTSHRDEVSTFLSSRRARLTPERAGVVSHGRRRVPGLRREEVAQLAGVSTDYYARLERGDLSGASEEVLDALAGALLLDEPERAHLFDLARAASAGPRARRTRPRRALQVRPGVLRVLEAVTDAPAFVRNGRRDVLAANRLGWALYSEVAASAADAAALGSPHPPNTIRFAFLDPRARTFFADWERTADDAVAVLRSEAGRHPHDRALIDLVGELATRSREFRTRWAAHDVRYHRSGTKHLHHPVVGALELGFEVLELPGDPGLSLAVYTAEAASPTADALRVLASWAATDAVVVP